MSRKFENNFKKAWCMDFTFKNVSKKRYSKLVIKPDSYSDNEENLEKKTYNIIYNTKIVGYLTKKSEITVIIFDSYLRRIILEKPNRIYFTVEEFCEEIHFVDVVTPSFVNTTLEYDFEIEWLT